jgi:hypothetical protein
MAYNRSMPRDIKEVEAELDGLKAAMLPAAIAEREHPERGHCPTCARRFYEHGGAWCACPTCDKPLEPGHGCKADDYVELSDEHPEGKIPF